MKSLAVAIAILGLSPALLHAEEPIAFAKSIQPIFTQHCFSCHGPDKQRAGLRLDRRADALKGSDNGVAFVPGKPAESLLLKLVTHADVELRMPPNKPPLTATEVATLRTWIAQGAVWPDDGSALADAAKWWSLQPLKPPAGASIDSLIVAKLREKRLTPSPEADRRTLIRRLSFDLLGLPPTPEEIDAFVNSPDTDAYEKLVDHLLASPHFGERWARHWLDVVHFGETHGFDKDQPRPHAWPYRDYVIRSFNADKPYAQFVAEQVAGDVLFPGRVDALEALGFLAAGPWDLIGHAEVPETKIDGKVARHLDRDDFVANTIGTFMGLTVHCAQCHNHKFDPITQLDYYRLQAVFAAIDRTNITYDLDPATGTKRREILARKTAAVGTVKRLEERAKSKADAALATLDRQLAEGAKASLPAEHGYHSAIADRQDASKWVQVDLGAAVAIEQIVLKPCHDDFNSIGEGFGFPVRFRIEASDDATFTRPTLVADHTTRDFANPKLHPFTITKAVTARYVRVTAAKLAPRQNDFILALAELEAITADGRNVAKGQPVTALDSIEAPTRWRKSNLTDGLAPQAKRSSQDHAELQRRREGLVKATLGSEYAELVTARQQVAAADAELKKLTGVQRTAYVGAVHTGGGTFVGTGANGGRPRPIPVLARGNVTQPGTLATPGAIAAIPNLPSDFQLPANAAEGDRRAALAKWITDPHNPLTWRVMANRVWQYHFGRALVDTPNDFGKMGQQPTHPDLLDFLAADLREHQSLKRLHKLIVMSHTYRQSSATGPGATVDVENRYCWRQNRRKLDAESVRDSLLMVAGKLDRTMGGPSFQDFVIEKPEHSPHYQYHLHDPNDSRSHRRSIYRFVVRSKQQPFLAALDCADPSLAVEKRNETQTPQQALALLNNRFAVTMAEHFATRVAKAGGTVESQMTIAFRLAIGRSPTDAERKVLADYAHTHGLPNACRVIGNLNEFLFVD